MTRAVGVRLGVIVPCRNEAAVITRRLKNLGQASWTRANHTLLVVDDGSSDETVALAEEALASEFGGSERVSCEVISNSYSQGKNGAICSGVERLEGEADVIVLTDADVLTGPDALVELAAAFEREPELGMATGVQRLHSALPTDSEELSGESGMGLYDTWTRAVRRQESRRGRLFSVHGQLLAWRAELGLTPGAWVADDLALMLQLRRDHPSRTVRMIEGADFHEERSPERGDQDLRRARAYLQATPLMDAPELGLQGWLYRRVPPIAPALAALILIAGALCALAWWGALALLPLAAIICALSLHPTSRRLAVLLYVIERARRAERAESVSSSWETARA